MFFFLYSAGEDGQVKVWSRSGMLRSTLSQNSEHINQSINFYSTNILGEVKETVNLFTDS